MFLYIAIILAIVGVLTLIALFLVLRRAGVPPEGTPDYVPVRLGVVLLGLVALVCVGGIFYVNTSPPTLQPPGEEAAAPPGGVPGAPADKATAITSSLGLSGQIVGILGSIASAAVGGIAGVLVGPRRGGDEPPRRGGDQSLRRGADEPPPPGG